MVEGDRALFTLKLISKILVGFTEKTHVGHVDM